MDDSSIISTASTVKRSSLSYLKIKRPNKSGQQLSKFDATKFFYLACYSPETFMMEEDLRQVLYQINNFQIELQKKSLSGLTAAITLRSLFPKEELQNVSSNQKIPYFVFPQEVVYAYLQNFGIKVIR